ncbi:hypothetical protein GGI59_004490 [Rhizobium lentis]|uniref:Integrase catalytic domain-containing protein n=1 Tax=Rhizobium lentis TaxID=1138194 RepID=A0A7W9CX29_9HYPH|nr:hypothetical protein [Rhizobium lentis]MBB5552263.1 hypothetical protein [Rhizobium lentis]MBB5562801.1 hypothetical protein [Rhizobium lentis]MBB5570984.1 hypothetical protein [Rhizobium lentis]
MAIGISAGSFLWASMTAIGLTALIAAYASVLTAIKIVGGLYLLCLAFKAFRSAASTKPIMDPGRAGGGGSLGTFSCGGRTRNDAKADVFDYIERFYNRRHSTLGYLSPMEFETKVGLA